MIIGKTATCIAILSPTFVRAMHAQKATAVKVSSPQPAMDRDLLEVTIPQLETLYRDHKYTVTQVVHWYLERVRRYNGVYGALEKVDEAGALATAAQQDAEARAAGAGFVRGPLWGVPIVIKENTSVRGLIT